MDHSVSLLSKLDLGLPQGPGKLFRNLLIL